LIEVIELDPAVVVDSFVVFVLLEAGGCVIEKAFEVVYVDEVVGVGASDDVDENVSPVIAVVIRSHIVDLPVAGVGAVDGLNLGGETFGLEQNKPSQTDSKSLTVKLHDTDCAKLLKFHR